MDKITCPQCGKNKIEALGKMCGDCWHKREVTAGAVERGEPTADSVMALDIQAGGGHYKDMPIQPVEFIQKNKLTFCEGAAIKYLCRHRSKNGLEDLKKARHFIDLLIDIEYGGEQS